MTREQYVKQVQDNFLGFIDTTLREGAQYAGIYDEEEQRFNHRRFSVGESREILYRLHSIGIRHAEVPNPLRPEMANYVASLAEISRRPNLYAHIRAQMKDLRACIDLGLDGVHVLAVANPRRIQTIQKDSGGFHTVESYKAQVQEVLCAARSLGFETRLGVEHAWDVEMEDMLAMYEIAERCGAARVNIADTRGTALPFEVADRVAAVRAYARRCLVQVHLHDDTGASVSNALAALAVGASFVDTSLLGIGERVGITPLSKIVVALASLDSRILYGFNTELIKEAEEYIAQIMEVSVPINLPSSRNAFAHTAGIHLNEIARSGTESYQAVSANVVGNQSHFVQSALGGKNGKTVSALT